MNKLIAATVCMALCAAPAMAAPYRGDDGQIEAYGALTGGYYSVLRSIETCNRFPSLMKQVAQVGKIFRANNDSLYFDKISKRMAELAYQNGGKSEQQRLSREKEMLVESEMKEFEEDLLKQIKDAGNCKNVLDSIAAGRFDLQAVYSNEIGRIMGNKSQASRTYIGLRLGAPKSEIMRVLSKSEHIRRITQPDSFTVQFEPTPVPIRDATMGWGVFKNGRLHQIAIRFFPDIIVGDPNWISRFMTVHSDVRSRLIEKYGAPINTANTMSQDGKSGVITTTWNNDDVEVLLKFMPPTESGITLYYTDMQIRSESEQSDL